MIKSLCETCKHRETCKTKNCERKEAEAEAYREAMRLDDNEDTLSYKFGFGG